jgi:hypothetical protein
MIRIFHTIRGGRKFITCDLFVYRMAIEKYCKKVGQAGKGRNKGEAYDSEMSMYKIW